ncbi:IucA/IucC family protein [Actinacidiphila glaucinigra]|uniref:IucA/IucC family protein n=1 Tax=Actinacidiphila glaucinigra TaxID=235986 RepID=UPI002E303173|nr:IucA/IucC family protein [Actinacidiphila glaucinigra]
MGEARDRAEALSATALLNCLLREVAEAAGTDGGRPVHRLPATGALLRVRAGRHPAGPELRTEGGWRPLPLEALVEVVAAELTARTGVAGTELPAEIADSRDVLAALLEAREHAPPPADPYLRSEQALVAGHRHHPAPKARGGGPPESWLPYAPEAHTRFPLTLLAVRADLLAGEGDTAVLDRLHPDVPEGYRVLPAHPWQLALLGDLPAFHDGRLLRLGHTAEPAVPTASLRTVYLPQADLFLKFSLDVRITNDIRRLWRHDLRWLGPVDEVLRAVPEADVLSDRGHRTADLGGRDAYEALAVVVRDGFGRHLRPGLTPLLAAAVAEGYEGSPLAAPGLTADGALAWWEGYLRQVVPPVLDAYLRHGAVLECHLQNVLVAVDADGLPGQVLFRDHEGVKLVEERHRELLRRHARPDAPGPGVDAAHGWERLVYCLVTNNLLEIAGAVAERHPELTPVLWARARAFLAQWSAGNGDPAPLRELLAAAHIPGKTNLLLRWTGADGAAARYLPLPNPLRSQGAEVTDSSERRVPGP